MQGGKGMRITLSLFLFCFVTYAISPLSHAGPFDSANEYSFIEQKSPVSFKNVAIFFLEALSPDFDAPESHQDTSSSFILLKKIKAIVQSLSSTKDRLTKVYEKVPNYRVCLVLPSLVIPVCESTPKPYDNFLAVFSGLSPPAA
jgi:hypothetical protein